MTSEQPLHIRKILLALVLLMAIPRWYASGEPLEIDLSLYMVMVRELLDGRQLYADLWEMRPPGVFITVFVAQWVAGYGYAAIFLLGMVASTLTLLGIYYAASSGGRGEETGLWAAGFWAVVSADVFMQADHPNVEALMNPCFVWAFALMHRHKGQGKQWGRWFRGGRLICLGLALQTHRFLFRRRNGSGSPGSSP